MSATKRRTARVAVVLAAALACRDAAVGPAPQPPAAPDFSVLTGVTVTDLGTLPGGTFSQATDVNAAGHAAGFASTVGGDFNTAHAVVWVPGAEIRDIGVLSGGTHSVALGINNLGQVVGYSRTTTAFRPMHAYVWSPESGMRDLGVLGGDESVALGINDAGQISGWSTTASGETHAVMWDASGAITDLGTLGGNFSRVNFLNEVGQAPGTSRITPNSFELPQAILWSNTTGLRLLGTLPGGTSSEAERVNNLGQAVGYSSTTTSTFPIRAVLWSSDGAVRDLGSLGGDYSIAFGINDLQHVVGASTVATSASPFDARPFLWTAEGGMVQLPSLGGDAGRIYDVSNRGIAVGLSRTPDGHDHAALWTITLTPTPPVEQIDNVIQQVANAVAAGAIPEGRAQGLLATLEAASRLAGRGNTRAAIVLLRAFVLQVRVLVRSGAIGDGVARGLIEGARGTIAALGGSA